MAASSGDGGDGAGQPDVAICDRAHVVTGQPNVYVGVAQVEVGMMVHLLGCRADRVDDREPGREVLGVDAGLQAAKQVGPPVQPLPGDLLSS